MLEDAFEGFSFLALLDAFDGLEAGLAAALG
jgi:hypothetical protein